MISKQIFILLIFFAIIFIISEFWNLLDKYTTDFSIKTLLIKDLKYILKYRGIDYKGVYEKSELLELINNTGETTHREWISSRKYASNEGRCNLTTISVIQDEALFNELVEDSKDSAWVLRTVLTQSSGESSDERDGSNTLSTVWCHIQSIYARYGVNMAILDCGRLYNLCWDRGFHRSPFVLVLPRGRVKVKDSVDFFVFPYSIDAGNKDVRMIKESVIDWLHEKLSHRVNQEMISHSNTQDQKLSSSNFPVHFISIYSNRSSLLNQMPPTSISAHSVKFTGRIHFWSATENNIPLRFREKIYTKFPNWKPPGHFFISERGIVYQYGMREGQMINYDALQLFFRDLCPNSNDIFVWNLLIINLLISFQIGLQEGSIALKLGYFIWYFLIFNLLYCSIFLSLLSSINVSQTINDLLQFVSFMWQNIASLEFCDHIRYLQLNGKLSAFQCAVLWLLLILVLDFTRKNRQQSESEQPDNPPVPDNQPVNRLLEPWDPEAGQQIAYLSSLGNLNLFLPQQPPLYISRLFSWSFQAPRNWASRLANKYKQNSKMAAKIRELCERNKTDGCDESDLSSDFSSGDNLNPSRNVTADERDKEESQWPIGYIFTKKCCICLDRFRQDVILCGLPCGHTFHDACIKKWLIEMTKDDCPQCRWPAYKEKP